jgi:hypothetical protein
MDQVIAYQTKVPPFFLIKIYIYIYIYIPLRMRLKKKKKGFAGWLIKSKRQLINLSLSLSLSLDQLG